jgi:ABC-type transport system involved in cytochrome c biogenesis permease component
VFWLLLGILVVLSLVVLALTLLVLWRKLKVLGRSVSAIGAVAEQASAALSTLSTPVRAPLPCPTCGAPASAATKNPVARRVPA